MQFAPIEHPEGPKVRRALASWVLALLATAIVVPNTGCSLSTSVKNYLAYNDSTNDFVMGFRNGVWARQAWAERRGQFECEPQLGAFGAGFRAGYASVAAGGNGCPPPVPPRKYWTWKYQTPEGQAKVAAWFSGFPYGAKAAEEEQAGEYQNIQVSYAIEHQYSPEFTNSHFIEMHPGSDAYPGGYEQSPSLEAVPIPGFSPAAEMPLNESAQFIPQVPPGFVSPSVDHRVQMPVTAMPVAYEQPVPPNTPLSAPPVWPAP